MNQEPWCMEGEEWRVIKGYEGLYEVSNLGRVRYIGSETSRIKRRILPVHRWINTDTATVKLCKRDHILRRLVAKAFVPNPDHLGFVIHIDGDYRNNRADNLRWVDKAYLQNRPEVKAAIITSLCVRYKKPAYRKAIQRRNAKLFRKPVRCVETGVVYPSATAAGKACGVSVSAIAASAQYTKSGRVYAVRKQKDHICLHFVYAELADPILLFSQPDARQVICTDTYEVFGSFRLAAQCYVLAADTVYRSCVRYRNNASRRQPRASNKPVYHFAYLDDYQKTQQG